MVRQKWTGTFALALAIVAVAPGSDFGSLKVNEVPRRQRSTVPELENVVAIEYVVLPPGDDKSQCKFTVKDAFTLSNTVARLKKVDWKQKGVNLENVRIKRPEIEMTLIEKKGKKYRYAFYWKGDSFIDYNSGRLLQTDCSGFRHDMIRAIILHYGKDNENGKKQKNSDGSLDEQQA